LTSLSRRRKLLVLASLRRISVSLCWTRGWSTRWTLDMEKRYASLGRRESKGKAPAGAQELPQVRTEEGAVLRAQIGCAAPLPMQTQCLRDFTRQRDQRLLGMRKRNIAGMAKT